MVTLTVVHNILIKRGGSAAITVPKLNKYGKVQTNACTVLAGIQKLVLDNLSIII